MSLAAFEDQNKEELSMIEVARAILEDRGRNNEMHFSELVDEVQTYLDKSDDSIRASLPAFYAELNTDGSFISLGENTWGLRSWYAIDEIDEEVITLEEDDEHKRSHRKVKAFLAEEGEMLDYSRDDPEDDDISIEDDLSYDTENPDDEKFEVESSDPS